MKKGNVFAVLGIAILIVVGLVLARSRARRQGMAGEPIGAFVVPDLPDWKKTAHSQPDAISIVSFERLVDSDLVLARVTEFPTPRGARAPTADDLKRREDEAVHDSARQAHNKANGYTPQTETAQPSQFGKYPALLVETHFTREGTGREVARTLRFVDGHDEYWIGVTYPEGKPAAKQLADAAWSKLEEAMLSEIGR